MNILILSTKMPWPPKDGGAIATLNLAGGLARNGANVTLLAMNTIKHYFNPELIPGRIKDLIHVRSVDVDTGIRPLNLLTNFLFSSYPYIADRFRSEPYLKELGRCLRETDFDIVQIEGPYLEYCVPAIQGHSKISLRAHNLEHRIWALRAKEEKNPARRNYFRSLSSRIFELEKKLLQEIDLLVPISESDAEGFSAMHHKLPVSVCPTGLDLADYPAGPTGDDIRLFYIGALDWAPNQEGLDWFFSKTWPAILSEWPETVLHVAGRNSNQYFNGTAPPNVYPEGEVEDAIRFYREHSVMIVPLLSGSGIRIKILEAMAMGKVVISSSTGAAGLGVRDAEHLFIANQPEDYLRILGMLHKQPNLMQEIGHQARQFVTEKFDNLVLSGNLMSFYKAQLT
jgi:glycosyltransferase involved in cell wall biosynthesis